MHERIEPRAMVKFCPQIYQQKYQNARSSRRGRKKTSTVQQEETKKNVEEEGTGRNERRRRERILYGENGGEVIKSRQARARQKQSTLEIKRNETNGELKPIFRG